MKELKYNIKYLFNKKELYLAIIIVFIINLVHVFLCVNESLRLNQFYEEFCTGEYQFILYNINVSLQTLLIIIIPIVCNMILSDSDVLENRNKITNLLITRIDFKKNIIVRFVLCFLVTTFICFFGFLFNYIILRFIYGTGNNVTLTQGVAFSLNSMNGFFLDNVRLLNPVLFVVLINVSTSIIYGLLSAFSYSISLFIKNKLIIYFIPIIFLVILDMLFSRIGLGTFSMINLLQPFNKFTIIHYFTCIIILIIISLFLIGYKFFKKDVLI
ncbi:MAG: hypothetical protein RSB77_06625 [Bacilli bacterium]